MRCSIGRFVGVLFLLAYLPPLGLQHEWLQNYSCFSAAGLSGSGIKSHILGDTVVPNGFEIRFKYSSLIFCAWNMLYFNNFFVYMVLYAEVVCGARQYLGIVSDCLAHIC